MEDKSNDMIRELRDRIDDIVTDTRINMRLLTKNTGEQDKEEEEDIYDEIVDRIEEPEITPKRESDEKE